MPTIPKVVKTILSRIWTILQIWQFWVSLFGGGIMPPIVLSFIKQLQELCIGWQILFGISSFGLIAVAFWKLFTWIFPIVKSKSNGLKQEVLGSKIPQSTEEPLIYKGFVFYPSREILGKYHPVSKLKETSCIWALWNAPVRVFTEDVVVKETNIQKLILPHPENSSIKPFSMAVDKDQDTLTKYICDFTRVAIRKRKEQDGKQSPALEQRIEVRWHKNLIGNTVTIGNPDSVNLTKTWILIEILVMGTSLNKRPSYRLEKEPYTTLFMELLDAFNTAWDNSKQSTGDEIRKWLMRWSPKFGQVVKRGFCS